MTEDKSQNFNVFAYGSLKKKKFVEGCLGKSIKRIPAKLDGYKMLKLPDMKYPVAIKEPSSSIRGILLVNLNSEDLKSIEEWEETPEDIYKEIKVIVETEEGKKEAFVYVWH
jgi:gamma-glutamylcyclotransferase (GGCT)/AIG2-like uncharacterized protein YtfP